MFACVSITPLGTPVLPLEKMMVASDDDGFLPPYRRRSSQSGIRRACSSARDLLRPGDAVAQILEEHHARQRVDAGLRRGTAST